MDDKKQSKEEFPTSYGDLTELNTCRLILDTVGDSTLKEIADNILDLLGTSIAIYEANGDYALGIFSSSWCQHLDSASRALCNTEDNVAALHSGKWICHDCCWNEASLESIKTKNTVDIECKGGIHLFAVPILANGNPLGSITMGYGDPPNDSERLRKIAELYHVNLDKLNLWAKEYISRTPPIINAAKSHLRTSAKLIGKIIEHKLSDKALRKSEKLYRNLVQDTPALVCSFLPDSEVTFVNKAYCDFFKIDAEEIIGSSFLSLIPEQDREFVMENIYSLTPDSPSQNHEHQVITSNGEIRWQRWLNRGFFDTRGKAIAYQSIGEDITERKQTEENLRESERNLKEAQRVAHVGSWDLNVTTGELSWSDETYRIYGFKPQEFVPTYEKFKKILHPEDIEHVQQAVDDALKGSADYNIDFRFVKPSGKIGWIHCEGEVTRDEQGTPVRFFGTQADITERKRIQDNIIEEKNKLEAFLASINDGITVQDTNFTILYQNNIHRELQGDHVGELCYQAYQNRGDICPGCLLVKCFDDSGVHRRETSAFTDNGIIHMEITASPIRDAKGNIVAAVETVRDITDKKKLEHQLIHTQKMESIGQLAGGVAHDFNNMLSVILGYTDLAMDKTTSDDPIYKDLQEISDAAHRSANITRQLLAYARKQTISPKVIDLNETIEQTLKMLRRLIGEVIELSWQPGSGHVLVFMDPSQLDQVLANLCVNARDAIDGTGKIIIETQSVQVDENYCTVRPGLKQGDFVMLSVSDNGCGMDKELLDKVFEPFFTTKDVGEGTGLGLSTVYGIVKQNNGYIYINSEPEKGTTFEIYLPQHQREFLQSDTQDVTEIPQSQGETVLVVEDEASFLKLTRTLLERLGYTVLDSSTPKQALIQAEKHKGELHLLVTDVIMPEMNGRELADKLHDLYPDLKVLYMSGYTSNVIAHHGVLDDEVDFIEKPFSTRDLAMKIRSTLNENIK